MYAGSAGLSRPRCYSWTLPSARRAHASNLKRDGVVCPVRAVGLNCSGYGASSMGRVGFLGRSGAAACPNLPQRRSAARSAANKSPEYQRFSSCAPTRSGPLWQIWTNGAAGSGGGCTIPWEGCSVSGTRFDRGVRRDAVVRDVGCRHGTVWSARLARPAGHTPAPVSLNRRATSRPSTSLLLSSDAVIGVSPSIRAYTDH